MGLNAGRLFWLFGRGEFSFLVFGSFMCAVYRFTHIFHLVYFGGKSLRYGVFFSLCPTPPDFMTVRQYTNKNLSTAVPHYCWSWRIKACVQVYVCVWERNFTEGRVTCIPTLPPPLKASIHPHKEVSGGVISFFMDAKYSAAMTFSTFKWAQQ